MRWLIDRLVTLSDRVAGGRFGDLATRPLSRLWPSTIAVGHLLCSRSSRLLRAARSASQNPRNAATQASTISGRRASWLSVQAPTA